MEKKWLFDRLWTQEFTKVRQQFINKFLGAVREQVKLGSALDVGCGVGYFSKSLVDMGFRVVAVDGREENVREGRRRYPEIDFRTLDVENLPVDELGTFDLVLCVGLLYHLENPFRTVRNLHSLTTRILLIETMCVPGKHPTMDLLDEGVGEDQGLSYVAFYPSESCLVKMLYRSGFPFVYRFDRLPADELFTATVWRKRQRTFLVASKTALVAGNLLAVKEPIRGVLGNTDPWSTRPGRLRNLGAAGLFRLRVLASRFLRPRRRGADSVPSGGAGVK